MADGPRYNYGTRRKMKKRTLAENLNNQGGLGTSYNSSSPETKQSRQRSTPVPINPGAMGGRSAHGKTSKQTAGFKRYGGGSSPSGHGPDYGYGTYPNGSPRRRPANVKPHTGTGRYPTVGQRWREGEGKQTAGFKSRWGPGNPDPRTQAKRQRSDARQRQDRFGTPQNNPYARPGVPGTYRQPPRGQRNPTWQFPEDARERGSYNNPRSRRRRNV